MSALSWSFIQEVVQRGLQLAIGILLARLLGPEDFGLIAMLAIFVAVSQALIESGFGSALIQRKNPSEVDYCSVFFFNILLSVILAGALCLGAPWIASFYNQPQLTSLTRALSLVLVINSFVVVQNVLLIRRLDFKRQTAISGISTGLSGVVGLTLAWRGFGVWSLVVQQVGCSLIRTVLYWLLNVWRPRLLFSIKALREMFGFGSGMVASSLLNTFFDNLYSLVIGKIFSPITLGFYNRASTFSGAASQGLGSVANRVTFPVFSQIQDDPQRLRRALRKAVTTIAFIQFPLMAGLAAVAKPLVLLTLGEKWAPCIPFLQLLCLARMLYPLHLVNLNILQAVGRSDLFFGLGVIKKAMVVLNIAITYRWGVLAMVSGMAVNGVLSYFLNTYYTRRYAGYSLWEQLCDIFPYLAASALMGLCVAFFNLPLAPGNPAQVAFKVCVGITVYWALSRGLRLEALNELLEAIRRRTAVGV